MIKIFVNALQHILRVFGFFVAFSRLIRRQWQDRFHHFARAVLFEDQHHPFAAAELGRFFDEEGLDLGHGLQRVEAQPGIREALERLTQIELDVEMSEEPLFAAVYAWPHP